MRKFRKWFFLVSVSGLLLVVAGFFFVLRGDQVWRREMLVRKAGGELPDMTWAEVFRVVRPGSGFWMEQENLDWGNANANLLINCPPPTERTLEKGKALFREKCAACHGSDARGSAVAPSLVTGELKHAVTDWSTYKTIERGIAGTSMPANRLGWQQDWVLVSYLRSLRASAATSGTVTRRLVQASAKDLAEAADSPWNWLMYSGTYDGQRHSRLDQISASNVNQLEVAWLHQLDGEGRQQAVPLVVDGIMFFSTPPANVFAVDLATGKQLWSYRYAVDTEDVPLCCGVVNRGLAISGDMIFLGTVDAHLVAMDASTGKVRWNRKVADYREGYSITAAPLAVNDLILTGVGGGEFPTRGFVSAYRASDGTPVWRFDTIPKDGEAGSDTWQGERSARKTGGGSTWMTGSFDPGANIVYWGVGNPAPTYAGDDRKGDNLYTNSVVALDAASGRLIWHFQFTPHDLHGWDSAQVPVLLDNDGAAQSGKLLAWPNRNGFFYSIDAGSGKFLAGREFVKQTWARGLSPAGRPISIPESMPSVEGTLVWPSDAGGTSWWSSTLDPSKGLLIVPALEHASVYFAGTLAPPKTGKPYAGGGIQSARQAFYTVIRALDARTGELRWEHRFAERASGRPEIGGLLSTDGGLVFGSDRDAVIALDAGTGKLLWSFNADAPIIAAPVTYAVNGRQYVAVMAGSVLLAFALPLEATPDET